MKNLIIYILFGGLICSCQDKLNISNPNQITVNNYWKSSADAVSGINAVYSTLHRGAISRWMMFYFIIRADEGRSQSPDTRIVNNIDNFTITDYNYENAYGIWDDNYIGIFRANQVLTYVPGIDMDVNLKNRILGEAEFMRGMFYYFLAELWGNVPIMLTPSTPADKPATSPQADVWAQVVKDLTDASNKLPVNYQNSDDVGRATKGAALALLAKAYMQQRRFSDALTPLQWLVTGDGKNVYDLMTNYRDNFLITSENNKESVFEWQFAENLSETTDNDIATPDQNYGSSIAQFFAPPGIGWSDGEAQRWPVYEFLREQTTTNTRDPRLAATFLYDSTDVNGPAATLIYGQTFLQRYGTNNRRIWFRKFLNDHWKNVEGYRSPNNYRFIRYADVLLMYAECLNETGSTAQAYQYVDRVRQRAGLARLTDTQPGLSSQNFRNQLKHERITELTGEGHRWEDLARWGDLSPNLASRDPGFQNFVVGKSELLPIPQAEIDINPNIKQNPGY